MAQNASRSSQKLLTFWLLTGLVALIAWVISKKNQTIANNLGSTSLDNYAEKNAIAKALSKANLSQRMIQFYTAVSALETDFWTSKYYKDLKNLFSMTLASKNTLAIGKAGYGNEPDLARFKSIQDSADDFVLYLFTRFNYPQNFVTLDDLAAYMKKKGYFQSSEKDYALRLNQVYNQLYGNI